MSGIEVAGLVLGSIPLVISALEHYQDGISTIKRWRKSEPERRSLIRSLNIERVKLKNVCQRLLFGVVPPWQVEAMMEEPFGPLWQDDVLKRRIRARLCESALVFEPTVWSVKEAMDDLMSRLGLGADGKPLADVASSKTFISKEFKRAVFTFNRATFQDLLSTIEKGVMDLHMLTEQNVSLEPKRRERSQMKLLNLLHELSQGLYRALRRSFVCACSHSLNLKLSAPAPDIMHGESETKILEELKLDLVISKDSTGLVHQGGERERKCWEILRIFATPVCNKVLPQLGDLPLRIPTLNPSTGPKKAVRFQASESPVSSLSSTGTLVQTATVAITLNELAGSQVMSASRRSEPDITDICDKFCLNQASRQEAKGFHGFVTDERQHAVRRYAVYSGDTEGTICDERTVTLKEALYHTKGLPPLSYRDRLRLAVLLSMCVMQLGSTPWLPGPLSAEDLVFFRRRNQHLYRTVFISRPLNGNGSPEARSSEVDGQSISALRDPTLLSLGFLLIELLLGRPLLSPEEEQANSNVCEMERRYSAAQKLLREVKLESAKYFSAVNRCLDGELHQMKGGADEVEFRENMYSGVVALLKEDLDVV